MSQENVEVIRRLVEAYNRGGIGAAVTLGLFDDAAVFEEPPEQPGPRTAEGPDASAGRSASSTRRGRSTAPTRRKSA